MGTVRTGPSCGKPGKPHKEKRLTGVSVEHGLPEVVLSQWVPTFLGRELAVKQEHARRHSLCDTR